jgi:hypothetical protein
LILCVANFATGHLRKWWNSGWLLCLMITNILRWITWICSRLNFHVVGTWIERCPICLTLVQASSFTRASLTTFVVRPVQHKLVHQRFQSAGDVVLLPEHCYPLPWNDFFSNIF